MRGTAGHDDARKRIRVSAREKRVVKHAGVMGGVGDEGGGHRDKWKLLFLSDVVVQIQQFITKIID